MDGHRKKFLIDTDAGVDDAQAILMALAQPDVDVVAITTTHGNTTAHQVGKNVLRVLKVADRLDIPVYRGAEKSLIGTQGDSSFYHGKDGLGDVPDTDPVDEALIKTEHAVTAMISMANKYKDELALIAIGPLTNVALAIRLDPEFGKKLKDCYIMGGNYEGKGNITPSAEFNFHTDPEAAQVVLAELGCPITIACWELCMKHSLPWETYDKLRCRSTKHNTFLKQIEDFGILRWRHRGEPTYVPCDELAMLCAIDASSIVCQKTYFATIECNGQHTRGQMVIDYMNKLNKDVNVSIVTELNEELYLSCLQKAVN